MCFLNLKRINNNISFGFIIGLGTVLVLAGLHQGRPRTRVKGCMVDPRTLTSPLEGSWSPPYNSALHPKLMNWKMYIPYRMNGIEEDWIQQFKTQTDECCFEGAETTQPHSTVQEAKWWINRRNSQGRTDECQDVKVLTSTLVPVHGSSWNSMFKRWSGCARVPTRMTTGALGAHVRVL